MQAVIEQADQLYGKGEVEKVYELLSKQKNSDDPELLWRQARAARDLFQIRPPLANDKKKLIYEARDYAKAAVAKNPNGFETHKWYAICLNEIGEYEGFQTKIENAFDIQKHFQKALELNAKDPACMQLLGEWSYFLAEMPWAQKQIAAMMYENPPTSTYEEALKLFQKVEEVSPNMFPKNMLFMAKTFLKMKNKEKAIEWFLKVKKFSAKTDEDKKALQEAIDVLRTLGIK
ncbi:regulator of microtubule dynamics protein 1 isoform X2 [Ambystoma mexicanum]|uniref:regulator of microtubule dynamics protein 1 isoform X2 n=1 Tax=Ambystoma mexicanum TaxID=8296 RepID=UPI0037E7FCEB